MIKVKRKKNKMIRSLKLLLIISALLLIPVNSFAEKKADCSKIKKDTLAGVYKILLCKKGSDKLDKDGNLKKGSLNPINLFKKKN